MEVRGYSVDIRYSRVCIYTYVMELIGECPKANAEACAKRLEDVMKQVGEDMCHMPFKCDADISSRWYYNEYLAETREEFAELCKGMAKDDAFKLICENRSELTPNELKMMLTAEN